MPLEISEIGIHVAVGPDPGSTINPPMGSGGGAAAAMTPAQHQAIVDACVQQVMQTLRQEQER